MSKPNLFELEAAEIELIGNIEAIFAEAELNESGEVPTTDPAERAQALVDAHLEALGAVQEQLGDKLIGYVKAIRAKRAKAQMVRAEAALYEVETRRLQGIASKGDDDADFLESRLKGFLERKGLDKLEVGTFTLKLVEPGGKLPVVIDANLAAEDLPSDYVRVKTDPDKTAIYNALKAGTLKPVTYVTIEGKTVTTQDWAKFGKKVKELKIK